MRSEGRSLCLRYDPARAQISALVAKGYLPKELPPPFTSSDLAQLLPALTASGAVKGRVTECVHHNLARVGGTRRPLGVPNPEAFIALTAEIQAQWTNIDAHFKSAKVAISRPVVTKTRERAVRPNLHIGTRPNHRVRSWTGQKYVLRADVGHFYGSLYTHSIPWALHTKATAKANKGKTDGDRIDKAMRNCLSGQTSGIPVGPDTSFIVAEIVLTAVDKVLGETLPNLRGFRYIDDYELAFDGRAEAEGALARLEVALAGFGLSLNPYKTEIVELPQPYKDNWTTELGKVIVRTDTWKKTRSDLIALFSLAAELARPYPGALNYALRRSRDVPVEQKNWGMFQSLLWSTVAAEPTAMAGALDLLNLKAEEANSSVQKGLAGEVLESIIARHAPVRNASEVAWAIWAALALDIKMSADAATLVGRVEDDFVALLALDAVSRGQFPSGALDQSFWESLVSDPDALQGNHWLLAYEGVTRTWLATAAAQVAADPFFSELNQAQVHFYDPNPTRAPFSGPAAPLPGGADTYA